MPRVYLTGPMTGIKDFNRPVFRQAADALRKKGFDVVSPDDLDNQDPATCTTWIEFLKRDIPWLLQCEMVVVLPG